MVVKLNKRKCKSCGLQFQKVRPLQNTCSIPCAITYANKAKEHNKRLEAKKERKVYKDTKEKLKSRQDHLREAQRHFNAYIRERDKDKPCISCNSSWSNQYAAGHYRTVGSMPQLRFEELNVHKQCNRYCNLELSGNILNYRRGLILRIGVEKLEWLEGHHEAKHYTIDEIKAIKVKYKQLTKELKDAQ